MNKSLLIKTKNKNPKIQILRAIAIICVVIIHTTPGGIYQVLTRPFTNIAVATFIFIFGFLTPLEISDICNFYNKRIIRVLIPYFIWIFIYTLVKKDLSSFFVYLLTSKVSGHLYYILVYIELVLITPFIKYLAYSNFKFLGFLISPLSIIIFNYIPWISGMNYPSVINSLWDISFLGWFTYFYIGILLSNECMKSPFKKKIIYLVILLFFQFLEGYILLKIGISNCGTQLKCSTLLTCVLFLFFEYDFIKDPKELKETFLSKLMIDIGDCSFGIYLSHMLIRNLFYHFVPTVFFPINSIVVFVLSYLFVLICRKILGHKVARILGFE